MSLLDALRRHTRQQHEALHTHPLLLGLSADRITLAEFHRILLAFEAYYTHAEAACATPWPEQAPNAPVLAWLASDLAQHRLESLASRLAFAHPPIDTPSRMAGYLYTKQGSTLGGHVISRHLERKLALIPHLDQWFFAGYHDNGVQWKQFIAALETTEGLDEAEVCEAARAAFDHIAQVCSAVAALTPEPVA